MIIGNLTEKVKIDFPFENNCIAVTGDNFILKEKVLTTLNDYFVSKGEYTLYFPSNRIMNVGREEIEDYDLGVYLSRNFKLREELEKAYDMRDPFKFEELEKGQRINCGYMELLNFFYSLEMCGQDKINVVIEDFQNHLHYLIQGRLLLNLILLFGNKIDKFIFSTHNIEPFTNCTATLDFKAIDVNNLLVAV